MQVRCRVCKYRQILGFSVERLVLVVLMIQPPPVLYGLMMWNCQCCLTINLLPVLTHTAVTRADQLKVRRTLALIGSLHVDARSILAHIRVVALIYVGTVASRFVKMVAFVTDATEHTKDVFTLAIHTQVTEHVALIYINTCLLIVWLIVWVRMHEAHLTVTAE